MSAIIPVAILFAVVGVLLVFYAGNARRGLGIPRGRLAYTDAAGEGATLVSDTHGLVGRPDYIIDHGFHQIPVELKPHRRAREPYQGDVMQLAAYMLLVEGQSENAPPFGQLVYADGRTFQIPNTKNLRGDLLRTLEAIREDSERHEVHRNHEDMRRCRACSFRDACGEALAQRMR